MELGNQLAINAAGTLESHCWSFLSETVREEFMSYNEEAFRC